jgi:dynein heavy chain
LLKDQKLAITKATDEDLLRKLENAIQFGTPLLLENVIPEQMDSSILSLLASTAAHHISSLSPSHGKGKAQHLVRVGDTLFACAEGFRLFITTQHPNPHFGPDATARATLIDFTLSAEGLEEQLLSVGVARIHAEIEAQKERLATQAIAHTQKLTEVEDHMLDVLSSAGARFLEDEGLVQSLNRAKAIARDLTQQLEEVELTTRKLNTLRSVYLPLASRAVLLFFVLSDLHRLDPMYHYSLSFFTYLFEHAITDELTRCAEREGWDLDLPLNPAQVPLADLVAHFTYVVYANVTQSLMDAHKQVFAFVLCARLLIEKGEIPSSHWHFMLTGMEKEKEKEKKKEKKRAREGGGVTTEGAKEEKNTQEIHNKAYQNIRLYFLYYLQL